jgi:hypothetical protein
MDKGGFFLVYRGVFPDFGDAPYTEREAWLWLIASAGYEDTDMGQINTTYSELARAWKWTYGGKDKRPNSNKARRFLDKMAQQGRITFCNNKGQFLSQSCNNLVTREICVNICNYSKYQRKENGSVTILSQPCNKEKKSCNNDPSFPQSSQILASPKQKNKQINNTVHNTNVLCLSEPVHPKPNEHAQTDPPVVKTKAQIKREKAEAKKADREHQLSDIESNMFSFEVEYPNVDIDLEFKKMVYWLNNTPTGKIRTDINKTWQKWLFREQTRLNTIKLFPRNNKNTQKQDSSESFLDQVKKEAEKLKQINERFTK